MCFSELDAAISAAGLPTRVRFCAAESAAQILQAAVPYGKVVLISEEGSDFALVSRLCESLREFRPVSVVLGKADGFAGLFSLADDIRAAVGVGARGALAARFFVTLRGGYSCAVPLSPCAGGIFEAEAPADTGWAGYPLKSADFVVADGERMRGRAAEVLAECSLAALCAEDIEIDAVFSRDRKTFDFRTPAEIALAAELTADGAKQLFCASALFQIALRGAPAVACTSPPVRSRCFAILPSGMRSCSARAILAITMCPPMRSVSSAVRHGQGAAKSSCSKTCACPPRRRAFAVRRCLRSAATNCKLRRSFCKAMPKNCAQNIMRREGSARTSAKTYCKRRTNTRRN